MRAIFAASALLILCLAGSEASPNANGITPASPANQKETRVPPELIYGNWAVAGILSEDGSKIAAKDASAWLGSKVRLTRKSIKITPPPKGAHRPSGLGFDAAETCTAAVYDGDIKKSASDLSAYKDLYRYFGLARSVAGRLYMVECNSAEDRGAELTHEDMAGPYLLYPYAPDKIIIAWADVLLLLTRETP